MRVIKPLRGGSPGPGAAIPCLWLNDGLLTGPVNAAIDRRLLAAGHRGAVVRLYRNSPTASLGRFQAAARELRLDHCRRLGIPVIRRLSGGGALYLDPEQQDFSVIMPAGGAPFDPVLWLERAVGAVARGLSRLGVVASFKAPNDLEVEGRKVASVFVARQGGTVLLQGTVLVGVDVRTALEVLRAPTEKLSRDGLASARDRLVTIAQCLGRLPEEAVVLQALATGLAEGLALVPPSGGIERAGRSAPARGQSIAQELRRGRRMVWAREPAGALEALWRSPGGLIRVRGRFGVDGRVEGVAFATDWQIEPQAGLAAVQRALRGVPGQQAAILAHEAAERCGLRIAGADARDLAQVMALLWQKRELMRDLDLAPAAAQALMVHTDSTAGQDILGRTDALLVPYCAKPAWCKFRHREDCPECGLCEVGEAYRMGRERGMPVITITHYEHLVETLQRLKEEGARAYLGMCCASFFVKRHRAFREAGMPAVLMDISGANCYALRQEEAAYAGRFEAEARIDIELLRRVMRRIPAKGLARC